MPNRREFIKSTTLAASATALTATAQTQAKPAVKKKTELFRQKLLEGLGGPWSKGGDLKPKKLKTEQKDGYRLEWLTYELEPGDRCPAILLVPDGVNDDPFYSRKISFVAVIEVLSVIHMRWRIGDQEDQVGCAFGPVPRHVVESDVQSLVQTLGVVSAPCRFDVAQVGDGLVDVPGERVAPRDVLIAPVAVDDDAKAHVRRGFAQRDSGDHLAHLLLDNGDLVPHAAGGVEEKDHVDAGVRLLLGGKRGSRPRQE